MDKPVIPKEAGKLKWICNEAFFCVKKILPETFRESRNYDEYLATFLGAFSGYGAASLGEIFVQTINNHGGNLNLESIASHSLSATVLTPVISYLIAPSYVKNFMRENPRYLSGAAGVMIGASAKAVEVIYF